MNIIIVGDKYHKGMKSKGCPALLPINKRTNILQCQYKILTDTFPQSKIIYIGGFEHKKIQNFLTQHPNLQLDFIINPNFNDYHEVDALNNILSYLNDDTIILSGYHVLDKKIFKNFNINIGSQIFVSEEKINSIGCIIDDGMIKNIGFDLSNAIANIYYVSKEHIKIVADYIKDTKFRNYFLFEIINDMIDQSIIFKPYFIKNKFLYDK